MSRLHLTVLHRFGAGVDHPWKREEETDLVPYRVSESVAAIILDSDSQPQP